jgi:pyruvate kinase
MKINFRKTKILGKIADNKSEVPFLKTVFDAGLDIAWLNTAHQGEDDALALLGRIKEVSPHVAVMVDTKGPEVRTKNVEESFEVKRGETAYVSGNLEHRTEGGYHMFHVDYPNFHNEVPVGTVILYDDATVGFVVEEKVGDALRCTVQNDGKIKNKKSINTPGVHIELPALTEKDKSFIRFCGRNNVEYIIHSFVRGKEDLLAIKAITDEFPGYAPRVMSKIENREGFDNLSEILDYSDGAMVARGDLGAEVPFEEMPFMQKKMIEMCVKRGKSCVVATQVLDSMIKNPRPTRAEVLDVANAVLEGSGAVSMSGETAYGDYPVEATTLMSNVMMYTENKKDELTHHAFLPEASSPEYILAKEIADAAKAAGAKAIFAAVSNSALYYALSGWRPSCIVVAATSAEIDAKQLMLYYAIRPVHIDNPTISALRAGIDADGFEAGDKIVVVSEEGGSVSHKTALFKDIV